MLLTEDEVYWHKETHLIFCFLKFPNFYSSSQATAVAVPATGPVTTPRDLLLQSPAATHSPSSSRHTPLTITRRAVTTTTCAAKTRTARPTSSAWRAREATLGHKVSLNVASPSTITSARELPALLADRILSGEARSRETQWHSARMYPIS